jgi:hypothetical protein
MNYVDFFSNLGFDFIKDLKSKIFSFEKNLSLTKKLQNSVFFFGSPNNTNTSFYLITSILDEVEIEEIRKYIWNKDDADLIFHYSEDSRKLVMLYAKYSPKINYKESVLDTFLATPEDLNKIEKIKHWQFDSGVFWLNYYSFIDKAKFRAIDKDLVLTLSVLKEQLNSALLQLISEENELNEVVQALIDRTLYIKYLEDNHIINFHFYEHYFKDSTLNYEKILENHSNADINKLFKKIHEIFNNSLFDKPTIDNNFLTSDVRNLIATSFKSNLDTGQLRLFDFQFDILPVEFISYIYEVFLSKKQKENGIYYTPKKLAQLIVDEVINENTIGPILDPSSGSGMFLIVGYQRLLEIAKKQGLEPENSIDKIKFRTKLLYENIFGIEKELAAQRFTLFSLSLQIFIGIDPIDIKKFIEKELIENNKIDLFSEYSFFENIKHANTLNVSEKPFEDMHFSYLVGNPPFFEVPDNEYFKNEISFLNSFKVTLPNNVNTIAKNIVGKSQISQCFFLKIKDWGDENTRYGFVSNSSNFYNDYSEVFQEYFFSNYGIEKIYELSRVKKILFEKAKESVVAIIFTNGYNNNIIDYYPVGLGLFSEKPFELLIIKEDKVIEIEQKELLQKQLKLRAFLVGNRFDRIFINKMHYRNSTLIHHIAMLEGSKSVINNGLQIVGKEQILSEFHLSDSEYRSLNKEERKKYSIQFKQKYTRTEPSAEFPSPLLEPKDLLKFRLSGTPGTYLGEISNFQRIRNNNIYSLPKILINRTGKDLKAVVSTKSIYYNFDVYSIFPKENANIYLFTALINSYLINYFIDLVYRKRADGSFPKIGYDAIKNIPIPRELDPELVAKISHISKDLSEAKCDYSEKEDELNQLIYNLYELSYWDKQRVGDYFLLKTRIGRKQNALDSYKATLKEVVSFYLKNPIVLEQTSTDFDLIVVKISLNDDSQSPEVQTTKNYLLNEIFEQNPRENFLASQEKIYTKDCVYIIKEDINRNWTETKAFEDAQDILNQLIPAKNGERIH